MKNMFRGLVVSMAAFVIECAQAQLFTQVDLTADANFSWSSRAQTDPAGFTGTYLPGGPLGHVVLGGIPFNIATGPSGGEAWNSWTATGGGSGIATLTLPTQVFGATTVHTLINTYWAAPGQSLAKLVFTGSAGSTFEYNLVGGADVRDWIGGSLGGANAQNIFKLGTPSPIAGHIGVLDMQSIPLPATFSDEYLVQIQLIDGGAHNIQRTILAGATISSVPEPEHAAMAGAGLLVAWAILRRRGR